MRGQNVVLSAGTGSGKTEGVMAPLVSRHWRAAVKSESLAILYVAPTKALVNDLERRLSLPLQILGLRVGLRHGDRDDLAAGPMPHVLLTTPESLNVLLFRKEPVLATLKAVVLDEVHLLYNSQRGLQLSVLLQQLRRRLASGFQWAALSATMGRLVDVRDFLFGSTEEAVFLEFSSHRPIDAQIRQVESEANFRQLIRRLTTGQRTKLLLFANARRECERLAGFLQEDSTSLPVFTHYSSLSPEVRVETESAFSAASSAICIATSTLELGIDIGDIDAILLWDVPGGVESFLQRIGRGNRRAHKSNVVCLVPDDSEHPVCDALRFLALLDAARKGDLPLRRPYDLYGAVGQQCLSMIASDKGRYTRIADLCLFFAHKPYLDRETIEAILAELAHGEYLQRHGFKNQYGADQRLWALVDYRLIYGNFGAQSQAVDIHFGSKVLGSVPVQNLLQVVAGDTVRFAGKSWHVTKSSADGIFVTPAAGQKGGKDFRYFKRGISFDAFLAERMWQIIHSEDFALDVVTPPLRDKLTKATSDLRLLCSSDQLPYMRTPTGVQYLTYGGYLVNRAIALITGQPIYAADDLSLLVTAPINWSLVPDNPEAFSSVFSLLVEEDSDQSIYQMMLPVDLQLREFLQKWLKDTTVNRVLARLSRSTPQAIPSHAYVAIAPELSL
jgi:ATP-dependent Lhr-like helicase